MWQAWIVLLAGVWALVSSFSLGLVIPANFIVTGIVMAVFGFWSARGNWQGYVNGFLGLWLIFSGFIPALIEPLNLLIVGIASAVLALWHVFGTRPTYARRATAH